MKKILALVLALTLLCCGAAVADTTIDQSSTDRNANTTLSYTITKVDNEEYIVTIPSSVTLTNGTSGLSGTITIKLDAPNFNVDGKKIEVKLTSSANDFSLKYGNSKIAYSIETSSNTVVAANGTVLSWTYSDQANTTASETLTVSSTDNLTALPAGTYTDTLTFNVSVSASA